MRNVSFAFLLITAMIVANACNNAVSPETSSTAATSGIKIAYVNGDSILLHYKEFKKESEAMEIKQRAAEEQLQSKGAALEKEIMTYQQKAQTGTLTGKEMEAREKYLGSRQEALLAERDRMAQEIMKETGEINKRLQAVLQEKLNAIKEEEGFDFILSYVEGGPLLVADKKYDITDKVLKELNGEETSDSTPSDTTGKK
jgi:outer membrane protein